MKKLPNHFDFSASRPRRHPIGMLALAVVAAALAWQALQFSMALRTERREAADLSRVTATLAPTASASAAAPPTDPAAALRVRAIQRVAQNLQTPWADLLAALEEAPQTAAALISIEPSASRRTVRLTAEARNLPAMLAYLSALQQDARLGAVVLVSHQVQLQSPGAPVRFTIQADWGRLP